MLTSPRPSLTGLPYTLLRSPVARPSKISWPVLTMPPVRSSRMLPMLQPSVLRRRQLMYACGAYFATVTNIFS